jgi:hypothetical protein
VVTVSVAVVLVEVDVEDVDLVEVDVVSKQVTLEWYDFGWCCPSGHGTHAASEVFNPTYVIISSLPQDRTL